MSIQIREYLDSDEPEIRSCIKVLKEYESQFDPDYRTDDDSIDLLFRENNANVQKGGAIYVALSGATIIGFVSLSLENKNDELILKKVDSVYISDLVVLPEHRGRGVGKLLLQKVEEFAKSRRINYLKLILFANNAGAKKFYEREGFRDYEITMTRDLLSSS